MTGLRVIHVRINDEATGRPTPARVRFEGTDGTYYPPLGRPASVPIGDNQDVGGSLVLDGQAFAYADGSFEIRLPPEPVRVHISKGPEYTPLTKEVTPGPGKLTLRFELSRWCDFRRQGWSSGDGRAHRLSPHAALLEASAEDIAVINLLAEEHASGCAGEFPSFYNLLAFSGEHHALERAGHLVVVNTVNRHPRLGSLGLLNCHRIVFPLRLGSEGFESWTLADLCRQCHRKRGLVTWAYPHECSLASEAEPEAKSLGETLADAILGSIDAFEVAEVTQASEYFAQFQHWYDLLNSGQSIPLIGSSGKTSNARPLGALRTYARLGEGEDCSYRNWIEAVRAGRTFVTSGPLLTLQAEGLEPQTSARMTASRAAISIVASAQSQAPFDRLQIVANGEVVAESAVTDQMPMTSNLTAELTLPEGGWLAARCLQSQEKIVAHSSPIFAEPNGRPRFVDPGSITRLQADLARTRGCIETGAICQNERQRDAVLEILCGALSRLAKIQQTA